MGESFEFFGPCKNVEQREYLTIYSKPSHSVQKWIIDIFTILCLASDTV